MIYRGQFSLSLHGHIGGPAANLAILHPRYLNDDLGQDILPV
jgi:hypothetical protein